MKTSRIKIEPLVVLARCIVLVGFTALTSCRPMNHPTGSDNAIALRMAHIYDVPSPTHRYGTQHLAEELARSASNLSVTVYPGGQLGTEEELLEQLVAGDLDMAIAGPSFLAMWHLPIGAFDAAYAFRDTEHMLAVAQGELMDEHWEQLRLKYGIRVLDTWAYGARHVSSNRPIRRPEDLKGMRLRFPAARTWQESGRALGASPMPIPLAELYMALQQGIADGQENPVPVTYSLGFHQIKGQHYLSMTGHCQSSIQILISDRAWHRLTAQQQTSLVDAVRNLGMAVKQGLEHEEASLVEQWKRDGTMEVIPDIDLDAFRRRARDYFATGYPFSELYLKIIDYGLGGD